MDNTTSVRTTRQQQIYGGPGTYGLVLNNDVQTPDRLHSVTIIDPYGNRTRTYLLRSDQKEEAIKYITELGVDAEGMRNALAGWENNAAFPNESDVNITDTTTTDDGFGKAVAFEGGLSTTYIDPVTGLPTHINPNSADTTIDLDAITEIIKGESQTPAQAASTAGISEENLIVQLLRAGKTNFDEVAKYYQDQYPGITAAQVEANFTNSSYAQGGIASVAPQRQGYYLGGATDGMADQIPATIDNRQPAALSDGEFVIPADVVSHLGNGNSSAGATQLHGMMDKVRQARTGSTKQGREINPNKFLA